MQMSEYYDQKKIITIILIPSYTKKLYPFSHFEKINNKIRTISLVNDTVHDIRLYPVNICNNHIQLLQLDESKKWIYGCRCNNMKNHTCYSNKYLQFINTNLNEKIYDVIYDKDIKHNCCDIFEKELHQLCNECRDHILNIIMKLFITTVHSNNSIIRLLKDDLSEIFINRFQDLINYCFNIWK